MTLGTILFIVFMVTTAYVNAPVDPDQVDLDTVADFRDAIIEDPLNIPNSPDQVKKVKLNVTASMCFLTIKPGEPGGEIKVHGEYAQANFRLDINSKNEGDALRYDIDFESIKSSWMSGVSNNGGNIRIGGKRVRNHITVTVPPDLLMDMNVDLSTGDYELDLSGLAVANLDLEGSIGRLELQMGEANQVPMEVPCSS